MANVLQAGESVPFSGVYKVVQPRVHSSEEATLIGYRAMTDTYLNSEARLRAR